MARAHLFQSLAGRVADDLLLTPLAAATVNLYQEGTSVNITETIYSAGTGAGTLANPLTAAADGSMEFWLEKEKRLDLLVSAAGYTPKRITVDVQEPQLIRYVKSVFDYMTEAQIADVQARTATLDVTAAVQAAITAIAATGGELSFPEGLYKLTATLTIPNDGGTPPLQRGLRFVGAGAWADSSGAGTTPYGGTTFRFDAASSPACIDTRGQGMLEISGITFWQAGTAHQIAFIQTTGTTLFVHHCSAIGHSTKTGTGCDQDFIVLGGTTTSIDGSASAPFQGYGTVIEKNWINKLRRLVYLRTYANAIVIRDNTVWNKCGGESAIELDGGPDNCVGNLVEGNLVEMGSYTYAVKATKSSRNTFAFNNLYDATGGVVAYYRLEATAGFNLIIAGYHSDSRPFVSDASSPASNTLITPAQSVASIYPQPQTFNNTATFAGQTNFTGGNASPVTIQPAADQPEGAKPFKILRSAVDDVNPGGAVFEFLQSGDFNVYNSAAAQVQFTTGWRTWQAVGAGGTFLIYTGSGGSNLDARANAIRLLRVSDASELFRIRVAPQSSARGAIQFQSTGPIWLTCTGTPEAQVTAPVGSLCTRDDGGANTTLYVKETGAGNTGWRAV